MLDLLLPRRCVLCGVEGTGLCRRCTTTLPPAPEMSPPPGFVAAWSLLDYEGPTRDLVAALKFHHHHDAVDRLGAAMAALVEGPLHCVTWAPTSAARRRRRGYDQSALLARAVAGALGVALRPVFDRLPGAAQTGRSRHERLEGPRFRCRSAVAGRLLVVDDVRTTGATLCAVADAAAAAGESELVALTLAVRR